MNEQIFYSKLKSQLWIGSAKYIALCQICDMEINSTLKRKSELLGEYRDSISIRLTPRTQVFSRAKVQIVPPSNSRVYATFVHEYWHYLLNISTPLRIRDHQFLQHLLHMMSQTFEDQESATSFGRSSINEDSLENFETLLAMVNQYRGDAAVKGEYLSLVVESIEERLTRRMFQGSLVVRPEAYLTVIAQPKKQRSPERFVYHFGNVAVEESLAGEIGSLVNDDHSSPPFPYKVSIAVLQYLGLDSLTPYERISLLTYALMTTTPAVSLLRIAEEYRELLTVDTDINSRLVKLWATNSNLYRLECQRYERTLAELVKRFKGRGLTEYSALYFADRANAGLRKRLEDPLFDVKCFQENKADFEKLSALMDEFPPCNILQETNDDTLLVERNYLVNQDNNEYDWNDTIYGAGEFLAAYTCQIEYAIAHAEADFPNSVNLDSKCPFYDACTHPNRLEDAFVCASKPWNHFKMNESSLCWYASGVQGLGWSASVPKRNK